MFSILMVLMVINPQSELRTGPFGNSGQRCHLEMSRLESCDLKASSPQDHGRSNANAQTNPVCHEASEVKSLAEALGVVSVHVECVEIVFVLYEWVCFLCVYCCMVCAVVCVV